MSDPVPSPFENFGDLFEQFFGIGVRDLEISDDEARDGVTKSLEIVRQEACTACVRTPCKACDGKGKLTHAQGFFMVQTACATCKGAGGTSDKPCTECTTGRVRRTAMIDVVVPPGVEHGSFVTSGETRVRVLVGGRPAPEPVVPAHPILLGPPSIPEARLIPTPAESRKATMLAIGAIIMVIAFAIAMLR